MSAFGTLRKLSLVDVPFKVIDANFFTPSYGTKSGGEIVRIVNYKGQLDNVTFQQFPNQINFACQLTLPDLVCVAPVMPAQILLFNSYHLVFSKNATNSNITLGTKFIIYQSTSIVDYFPKVISTAVTTSNLSVGLNSPLTMHEGSGYLVFAESTISDSRYNVGLLNNSRNVSALINSIPGGLYRLGFFYFNDASIEFRSMFLISQYVNLSFVTPAPIAFVFPTNLFHVNTSGQVTLQFTSNTGVEP